MVDTIRQNAAITALFPDNATQQISEQDIRDLVVTTSAKAPRVSVKQYGAVGNGTTNDRAAIQAAIDAITGVGGYVVVPPSDDPYIVDGTLAIKPNTILTGHGHGSVLKLADGSNTNLVNVTTTNPLFGLRNLVLHGNRANQNGDATKVGLNIAIATTNSGYGGISTFHDVLTDSFYRVENLLITQVDGTGVWTQGASGFLRHIRVEGVNAIGIRAQTNDAEWSSCSVRNTAHEGWLCAGGSARYTNCVASWCGTGFNQVTGTYGNYVNGHGFRVLSRGQHFSDCRTDTTDGWGFTVQQHDLILAGIYIDQACQLVLESTRLGMTPRGGGFTSQRAGMNLQGAQDDAIDVYVTSRGVAAGVLPANLQGIIRLNGATSNNVLTVTYPPAVLQSGGGLTFTSGYSGSGNRILSRAGITTI